MPAENYEEMEDRCERICMYHSHLDDVREKIKSRKINERCVQGAICIMMNELGLNPKTEQAPSDRASGRMDICGEGYIVEIKMSFDFVTNGLGQLLYYANERFDGSRMVLAVHSDEHDKCPFDLVSFCDEHYITLCKAEDCAHVVKELVEIDKADDKADMESFPESYQD